MAVISNLSYSEYCQANRPTVDYILIVHLVLLPIGILTSLISLIIFSKRDLLSKSYMFRWLQAMSAIDFSYLVLILYENLLSAFCSTSSVNCGQIAQLVSLISSWIIVHLVSSALAITNILLELILTFHRLQLIRNSKSAAKNWSIKLILPLILTGSLLFYMPAFIVYRISSYELELDNSTIIIEYTLVRSDFGQTRLGYLTPIITSLVRFAICGPILFILNMITVCAWKRFMSQKRLVTSSSMDDSKQNADNNKLTMMLIVTSLLYSIGNLPWMVYYSSSRLRDLKQNVADIMFIVGVSSIITFISLKMVVYFSFNRVYRAHLINMIKLPRLKSSRYLSKSS